MSEMVLLTGASGRIGSRVLELLLARGYAVRALAHTTPPSVGAAANLEVVKGDILNQSEMVSAVRGCDCILHLAAAWDMFPPAVFERENNQLFESVIRGSYNLLEAARISPSVKLFLYASTDATYATGSRAFNGPITEETELFPSRFYGLAKIAVEEMCVQYGKLYSLPWAIARICWTLEPREFVRLFTYEFWEQGMTQVDRDRLEPLLAGGAGLFAPLNADGSSGVDHASHPADIADGVVAVIRNLPRSLGRIYNLAGPRAFHYLDVVRPLSERSGLPWQSAIIGSIKPYELSIERARRELGYDPRFGAEALLGEALPAGREARTFREIVAESLV